MDITAADTLYNNTAHAYDGYKFFRYGKNLNGEALKISGTAYAKGFLLPCQQYARGESAAIYRRQKVVGLRAQVRYRRFGCLAERFHILCQILCVRFRPTARDGFDASIAKAYSGLVSRQKITSGYGSHR